MKLRTLIITVFATASLAQSAPPQLDLKVETLHPLIVRTARRIQEKFQRIHREADGLVETVEAILAMPEPEKKDHEGDPSARMGSHMELMIADFSLGATLSGVNGYVLDNSAIGHQQAYQDLEQQTASDAAEVRRWLDMEYRAAQLKWKDKEEKCSQRAIGAARALVTREPKNAEAHALLAFALDWDDDLAAETLASLETALKLDSGQPLARQLMLARRVKKAVDAAALRRELRLDEKSPQESGRAFFDHPLDDNEFNNFTRMLERLHEDLEKTLANAVQRRDIAAYLRTLSTEQAMQHHLIVAAQARRRENDQSYEAFEIQTLTLATASMFSILKDENRLHTAVDLAANNGEALGTVALLSMLGRVKQIMQATADLSQVSDETLFTPELEEKLMRLATSADNLDAARACETLCLVEMLRAMVEKPARHPELVLRMIELDPFRHRTLQFLLGACMASNVTKAAGAAVARMQLAVLPCMLTRRQSAASAASMHDWETALRLLEDCEKDSPGDLMVLSQRVATTLRQSQSKAAIKKAGLLYSVITPDTVFKKTGKLSQGERQQFLNNFILYHALKHDSQTAEQLLKQSIDAKIHTETAAAELRKWMEK